MKGKAQYKTRQFNEILEYLQKNNGKCVTAADIYNHFEQDGKTIGMSTIYRHLERMVREEAVIKSIDNVSSGAYFEYIGNSGCCCGLQTYNCKCSKCGREIRLKCSSIAGVAQHIEDKHGFLFDMSQTVFMGVCSECNKPHHGG